MFASVRKLSWALLLPLLLVFAQQGELRHEYSHLAKETLSCQKAPADGDHCLECLAFAQIGGVAKSEVTAPVLLTGLAFHFTSEPLLAGADVSLVSPRNRGPPLL